VLHHHKKISNRNASDPNLAGLVRFGLKKRPAAVSAQDANARSGYRLIISCADNSDNKISTVGSGQSKRYTAGPNQENPQHENLSGQSSLHAPLAKAKAFCY
jgi:hypothetical protein